MRFAEGRCREMVFAAFAVGMERFENAIDADLAAVALGRGASRRFVANTGAARWLQERARAAGSFATSEVQVSETETPLHRWETVYRRLAERLATADTPDGALRSVVDAWFYTLEEDVLASGRIDSGDADGLLAATDALVEQGYRGSLARRRRFPQCCVHTGAHS
jgi:P-loop Domain of unknown function (DUF2791)